MTADDIAKLKDLVTTAVICVSASAAWLTFSAARRDRHEERLYAELPVLNALEADLESIRLMARGEYDDTSEGGRWFDPYYVHPGIRSKRVSAFSRSTAARFFGEKLARLTMDLQAAIDRFRADRPAFVAVKASSSDLLQDKGLFPSREAWLAARKDARYRALVIPGATHSGADGLTALRNGVVEVFRTLIGEV